MMGPQEFESAWIRKEQKIVDLLTHIPGKKPLLLVAFLFFVYLTFDLWTQSQFPKWSRFYIAQDRLWATYILVGFSFIPLFINQLRNSSIFLVMVVALSWLYPVSRLGPLTWGAFLPIVFLVLGAVVINSGKWSRWLKLGILFILFLSLVSFLTYEALQFQNNKILLYFSNLHLDLLFIYFIGALFNSTKVSYQIHFNPLQLMSPLPLPEKTQICATMTDYNKQFVQGMIELLQAQIIFIILIVSYQSFYVKTTVNPLVHYFLFLGFIVAAMKCISALLWIYGIKSIPATYFLVLAKSPIEVWQRGAVYLADFIFNVVYMPVWKYFRKQWLAAVFVIFAILFHMFLFHEFLVKSILRFLFGSENFGTFNLSDFRSQALWIGVWLAWIGLFFVFQKLTRRWHKLKPFQWLLIILTHLGSAFVIPLVSYLGRIV